MQRSNLHNLFLVLSCWMLLQLILRFLGMPIGVVLVAVSGAAGGTIYLLRFDNQRLAPLHRNVIGKQWVNFISRLAALQSAPAEDRLDGLSLRTAEDFDWFRDRLREEVFGHDHVLRSLVGELRKNALLRARSDSKQHLPPLAVVLLAGNRGTGKRHLAQCVSKRLFERPKVTSIDIQHIPSGDDAVAHLFGSAGKEGALARPVRLTPAQVIVLENIEHAGTKLQDVLKSLFVHGVCMDGGRGGVLSFEKCVFVLTTTEVPAELQQSRNPSRAQIIDALNRKSGLPGELLDCATICAALAPASTHTQAQVILQLMIDECRRYDLNLAYVEPQVVAREIEHFSASSGFEYSRIRIARWMSHPIHLAIEHGLESLTLTSDLVEQDASLVNSSIRRQASHTTLSNGFAAL
ncbi:MAG: hypothetical protein KDB22_05655 [Planctomycetales bacterium]|nr:hypothetical protein [Planctomycetales bacterium]